MKLFFSTIVLCCSCAGLVGDDYVAATVVGFDSHQNVASSIGYYQLKEDLGWYIQAPFYSILTVALWDEHDNYFDEPNFRPGTAYEHTMPMTVSIGRTVEVAHSAWLYGGAGIGFNHVSGYRETPAPGFVEEFSDTRDAIFNANFGLMWMALDSIGLHLDYNSGFNMMSYGILFAVDI